MAFTMEKLALRRAFRLNSGREIDRLKERCYIETMTMDEMEDLNPPVPRIKSRAPSPSYNNFKSSSRAPLPRKPLAQYNGASKATWRDRDGGPKYPATQIKRLYGDHNDAPKPTNYSIVQEEAPRSPARAIAARAENTSSVIARLTREYWDVHRVIANAASRARFVENQLSMLGADIPEDALNVAEQLRQMELCIEEEHLKLKMAETILEDVLRECETPVVVPELLKLVVEMSDDL
ncbi:hypothetical protein C8R44DRAFT_811778 [Mycena epipterygia]|nr:hypothetical protein C8R44DRAFT_811778 [Mycena epipterygia]